MKRIIYIIFLLYCSPVYADEKQDCEIMKYESGSITLGFKAGSLGWGVGPEISFGSTSGVVWKENLQYMVAEYQRSRDFTFKMNEVFRRKKQSMFQEMENLQ